MGAIAASWVMSPLLGGLIAAAFLYLTKRVITYQGDMVAACVRVLPMLLAVMAWAFATYLALKGLKHLVELSFFQASLTGLAAACVTYLLAGLFIRRAAARLDNTKQSINTLFVIPLICAAALLSFAHGANDVANAVGPLAAIHEAIMSGGIAAKAAIPIWVMIIGAAGIALGLALYGPKLIRTVGTEITNLDQMRAFCVAMAASITVIIASQFGLPVSSTHIAVGAVFGVGFLREHIKTTYASKIEEILAHYVDQDNAAVGQHLERFELASFEGKGEMLRKLKQQAPSAQLNKRERKGLARSTSRISSSAPPCCALWPRG
jgi:PiT family inorganic phosphate transporter